MRVLFDVFLLFCEVLVPLFIQESCHHIYRSDSVAKCSVGPNAEDLTQGPLH